MTHLPLAPTLHMPSSCFTCNKWLEGHSDRLPFPDRSIDIIQEFCWRVGCIQVGSFTGVYYRPTSNSNIGIELSLFSKLNGIQETWNTRKIFQLVRIKPAHRETIKTSMQATRRCLNSHIESCKGLGTTWRNALSEVNCTFGLLAPHGHYHTFESLYHILPRNSILHL